MSETADADFDLEQALAALDPFERKVAEAYAGDAAGNITKAFALAGHPGSYGVRATLGSRLLKRVEFTSAVNAMLECDELVAGRIERLRWLTRVMRGDEKEMRAVGRDDDGQPILVDSPPAIRDRLAAEAALSKLQGDAVQKVALTDAAGKDRDLSKMATADLFALTVAGGKTG